MNVGFLVSVFPKLSETFLLNQVTGLLDAGHEVTVFAQRPPDTEKRHNVVDEYELLDRTVYTESPQTYTKAAILVAHTLLRHPKIVDEVLASLARGKPGGERIANIRTLMNYDRLSDLDVIHGHFGTTSRAFDFLAGDSHSTLDPAAPFVVSFYGYDVSEVLKRNPSAYTSLFPRCDTVTVLSDDMAEKLVDAGCSPEKVVKQQLAVDTGRFRFEPREPSEHEPIRVTTVARFTEKKGLKYAVDAIARLADEYDLKYRIAGDGPLYSEIEARVQQYSIEDSVDLLGWVDQEAVQRELMDAHVFLLPSVTASDGDQEGTPTVLLEAQAVGLPVVSTHHAGIPEIVADGESGLLVPERDVDALTTALRSLFDSPRRWSEMGRRGREIVESTHSIPIMMQRLETIYQNALNSAE